MAVWALLIEADRKIRHKYFCVFKNNHKGYFHKTR